MFVEDSEATSSKGLTPAVSDDKLSAEGSSALAGSPAAISSSGASSYGLGTPVRSSSGNSLVGGPLSQGQTSVVQRVFGGVGRSQVPSNSEVMNPMLAEVSLDSATSEKAAASEQGRRQSQQHHQQPLQPQRSELVKIVPRPLPTRSKDEVSSVN
jgi:hypothetical protein